MTAYADDLRALAEPRPVGDTIKDAIRRACRASGLPPSRTFNIWYGRARRIEAHEADKIRAALDLKREDEARNELQHLRTRLLQLESRIAAESQNHHREAPREVRPRLR